jgi:hypothetical protein
MEYIIFTGENPDEVITWTAERGHTAAVEDGGMYVWNHNEVKLAVSTGWWVCVEGHRLWLQEPLEEPEPDESEKGLDSATQPD